jgi:hypothetical protein
MGTTQSASGRGKPAAAPQNARPPPPPPPSPPQQDLLLSLLAFLLPLCCYKSAAQQRSDAASAPRTEGAASSASPYSSPMPNGCGWDRPGEVMVAEEKQVYNAGTLTADTCYCHHFSEDGWHCNLKGLPSSKARKCCGVMYFSIGLSGKKLICGPTRGGDVVSAGHDPCNADNCPFFKESGECPYMAGCQ